MAVILLLIGLAGIGALFSAAMVAVMFLLVRDTARQEGKMGINLKKGLCPQCGEPAPTVRMPKNFRQAMWGGNTCAKCGCEYDKYGVAVT